MIQLDNEYRIEPDSYNWVLIYESQRIETIDGIDKTITSKDSWYYPTINTCIKKYVDQSLKSSESIEDLISRLNVFEKQIMSIDFSATQTV